MSFTVDLRPNRAAIEDLAYDAALEFLAELGVDIAERAGALAPQDTGGGAGSFGHVVDQDAQSAYVDVGPDDQHYYMSLVETGTEDTPAQPHQRPALEQTTI